jgi:hypothetical protein
LIFGNKNISRYSSGEVLKVRNIMEPNGDKAKIGTTMVSADGVTVSIIACGSISEISRGVFSKS